MQVGKFPAGEVYVKVENVQMEHCWDEIAQWALRQRIELTIEHRLNFTKINHRWVE